MIWGQVTAAPIEEAQLGLRVNVIDNVEPDDLVIISRMFDYIRLELAEYPGDWRRNPPHKWRLIASGAQEVHDALIDWTQFRSGPKADWLCVRRKLFSRPISIVDASVGKNGCEILFERSTRVPSNDRWEATFFIDAITRAVHASRIASHFLMNQGDMSSSAGRMMYWQRGQALLLGFAGPDAGPRLLDIVSKCMPICPLTYAYSGQIDETEIAMCQWRSVVNRKPVEMIYGPTFIKNTNDDLIPSTYLLVVSKAIKSWDTLPIQFRSLIKEWECLLSTNNDPIYNGLIES